MRFPSAAPKMATLARRDKYAYIRKTSDFFERSADLVCAGNVPRVETDPREHVLTQAAAVRQISRLIVSLRSVLLVGRARRGQRIERGQHF